MVDFYDALVKHKLIAIVRGPDPDAVYDVCRIMLDEGIKLIEVPLTTPDAASVIHKLVEYAAVDAWVGAGTVLTDHDVDDVKAAGGQFIVTPALTSSLERSVSVGLPVIAGAYSPTEIYDAYRRGAAAVKLFPASGNGVGYFKALRDPFPNIPVVAVGGVDATLAREYMKLGAVGVGVGSPLVGDALSGGDPEGVRDRVRQFREALS